MTRLATAILVLALLASPVLAEVPDGAPASPAPWSQIPGVAAPESNPTDVQMKTFYFGAILTNIIKECDVPTTGRQRIAFDRKYAALRAEIGEAASGMEETVAKRPGSHCPSPERIERTAVTIQEFIDNSTEDFIAIVDRRMAEDEAAQEKAPRP